ncbi:signal peptidase complex subunit 2 [Piptocephalis cylindrospora]|uniref:Signal peptidase complex subunit 2 n=1 Tax=Piptocephalis cylindrospora TaxID=1907219 RepID=A0A4P9Y4N8_9FUNG|nr:signal peptidase complex subunit 2 [Piptocephalis cylindrospora]|eukprot:RKP13936.1 signal peptidase complex subunit 2 [Piptocephalis cylindrospora]
MSPKEKVVSSPAEETPVQVNINSLTELKVATDDAVVEYLTKKRGFRRNNFHTDLQLFLGFLASGVTMGEFYYSWKHPGVDIRSYTIASVVFYVVITSFLTFWAFYRTKDLLFLGKRPEDASEIAVRTGADGHKPLYKLSVHEATSRTGSSGSGKKSKKSIEADLTAPYSKWFHTDGFLSVSGLEAELAKVIQ